MKVGVPASVYVIDDPRSGLRKVGMSINPKGRTKQLRLRPHHVVYETARTIDALKVEQIAHRLLTLTGKHVREELFSATLEECVQAIERAERIVDGLEPPLPSRPRKKPTSMPFDGCLLARLQAWLEKQEFPPSKTAVLETALREFLDRRERKK